jgi:cyanophycinase-like exopeptidase
VRKLQQRIERIARAEERRRLARMAERLRDQFSGLSVSEETSAILVRGRGILRRRLGDPALRFVAELSR